MKSSNRVRALAVAAVVATLSLGHYVPAAAGEGSDTSTGSDADKVICKKAAKTGSRFSEKVCKTKQEWDAIAQQARNDLQKGQQAPPPPVN